MNRREFLRGMMYAGAGASMATGAGCRVPMPGVVCGVRVPSANGAPMQGFHVPPMPHIRVGFAGLGGRGTSAMRRIARIPGCEVTGLCDLRQSRMNVCNGWLKAEGFRPAKEYVGPEAYKAMCDSADVDVVYVAGSWQMHEMVGLYAVRAGKHTFVEVPAALSLDGCWAFVEEAERAKVHCMMLENCCYGEEELLALNLMRKGLLGEAVSAECAYIHDLKYMCYSALEGEPGDPKRGYWDFWRLKWNAEHKGNQYPTHGLGPVCQYMNVNRGDRLSTIVSMETEPRQNREYAQAMFPAGDWRAKLNVQMGDMNMSMIRTALGRVILVQHDVTSPGPYGRINRIVGTRGLLQGASTSGERCGWPLRVGFDDKIGAHVGYFSAEKTEEVRQKYRHPYFTDAGELAKKIGGHGGMDMMMDLKWVYCLQNGLPMDMDVYDLASWCCVCELSERSVRTGSMPQAIPDFTRGGWRTAKPLGIETIDMRKFNFDKARIKADQGQMSVS